MIELSETAGGLVTDFLRGRGTRRSRGGADQRSPDRGTRGVRVNPVAPLQPAVPEFGPMDFLPRPFSAPPPYQDSVVCVNNEPSFSGDDVERAARRLGEIRRAQPNFYSDLQRRQLENIRQQTLRPTNMWENLKSFLGKCKHKRLYIILFFFGLIVGAVLFALLAKDDPTFCPPKHL